MEIIVVGCGRLGAALAYRLFLAGHKVAVIDSETASFNNLPSDFQGRLHEGDALSYDVLVRAGIEHADSLAAVTNSDALNAVVGYVAKTVFHLKNVVARNYDPRCREIFEEFDLQVVSSASWGAQRVEEMLYDTGMHSVFSAGNGEVEVYELAIPEQWNGSKLGDLLVEKECVPISITRAGRASMPDLEMTVSTGDLLHVSATFDGINCMRSKLQGA